MGITIMTNEQTGAINAYDTRYDKTYSIDMVRVMAEKGDNIAQCAMGDYYCTPQINRPHEAMHWYALSADGEHGNAKAQCILGQGYLVGFGVEKDLNKAKELLERSSRQHYVEGEFALGSYYFTTKDYKNAEIWLKKAVTNGHKEAKKNLEVVQSILDFNKAQERARASNAQKSTRTEAANRTNAASLEDAQEIDALRKRDDDLTHRGLLLCSALLGNPQNAYDIGQLHLSEQSFDKYILWLERAAEQGLVIAQHELGMLYVKSTDYLGKDIRKGVSWLKKAADQNDIESQYQAGYYYRYGEDDFETDETKAFRLLEKAAKAGHPKAQYLMGMFYRDDSQELLTVDESKSAYWFGEASKQGHIQAANMLAAMNEFEFFPDADPRVAFELYTKVAAYQSDDQNEKESIARAKLQLGAMYYTGKTIRHKPIVKQDLKRGVRLIEEGKKGFQHKMIAMDWLILGSMFIVGDEKQNEEDEIKQLERAVEYLTKAVELGEGEVQDNARMALNHSVEHLELLRNLENEKAELDKLIGIDMEVVECYNNYKAFNEKLELLLKWRDLGTGSAADRIWDYCKSTYGASPLEAVRKHDLKVLTVSDRDMDMLRGKDDERSKKLVDDINTLHDVYQQFSKTRIGLN